MEKLLDQWEKTYKDKHGNYWHEQIIFLCLFFLLMACYIERPWSYSRIWFESWQQKLMNLFCTCVAVLTVRSQFWSRGNTHKWSTDLDSPATCGKWIRNGTQHWALGWRNKLIPGIIPHAHSQNYFLPPVWPPPPPHTHSHTVSVLSKPTNR